VGIIAAAAGEGGHPPMIRRATCQRKLSIPWGPERQRATARRGSAAAHSPPSVTPAGVAVQASPPVTATTTPRDVKYYSKVRSKSWWLNCNRSGVSGWQGAQDEANNNESECCAHANLPFPAHSILQFASIDHFRNSTETARVEYGAPGTRRPNVSANRQAVAGRNGGGLLRLIVFKGRPWLPSMRECQIREHSPHNGCPSYRKRQDQVVLGQREPP
jgi:hypothetical protein